MQSFNAYINNTISAIYNSDKLLKYILSHAILLKRYGIYFATFMMHLIEGYEHNFNNIRCSKKKSIIFPFNFMQK